MEHNRDQDYLVYPVIFLYRHHVELALKNSIRRIPYLINRELTEPEQQHLGRHRLDLLWQDLKPMLTDVSEEAGWEVLPVADVEGIDSYIRQLTELDPDSFAFRYTRSKSGTPSLPPDLKLINLRHFAEIMERLADYLDAFDSATLHLEETKAEMEAEWRSDMPRYEDYR